MRELTLDEIQQVRGGALAQIGDMVAYPDSTPLPGSGFYLRIEQIDRNTLAGFRQAIAAGQAYLLPPKQ